MVRIVDGNAKVIFVPLNHPRGDDARLSFSFRASHRRLLLPESICFRHESSSPTFWRQRNRSPSIKFWIRTGGDTTAPSAAFSAAGAGARPVGAGQRTTPRD